jgi:hypothetical protein
MIITESFVWINYPKTASTYVREVLKEIYKTNILNPGKLWRFKSKGMREVLCPELRPSSGARYGTLTPHGTVSQIPESSSKLPVVTCFRDPVARYLSLYNYGDWKNKDQFPKPIHKIKERFPKFPELSLLDFIKFTDYFYGNNKLKIGDSETSIGPITADFLRFFTTCDKDENSVINYASWDKINLSLNRVKFLDYKFIRIELHKYLTELGFHSGDIEQALTFPPINVSPKQKSGMDIDEETKRHIEKTEWFLSTGWKTNFLNCSGILRKAFPLECT